MSSVHACSNGSRDAEAEDRRRLRERTGRACACNEVAKRLAPLLEDEEAKRAVQIVREDFAAIDSIGPRRAAEFLHGGRDDEAEADALGAVRDLLDVLPA